MASARPRVNWQVRPPRCNA